jgi:hypothetical protein
MRSRFGNWSPNGLPNFQRVIARVKTHWIEKFFLSLENLLERRCPKWACMTHLSNWNISYAQKKGRESNYQFDSRPLKVRNRPNLLTCRWCATYRWKALDEGYNFSSNLISIGGLRTKLWASNIVGAPILEILGFPLRNPKTKWHLKADPMAKHIIYYKGEGGVFP